MLVRVKEQLEHVQNREKLQQGQDQLVGRAVRTTLSLQQKAEAAAAPAAVVAQGAKISRGGAGDGGSCMGRAKQDCSRISKGARMGGRCLACQIAALEELCYLPLLLLLPKVLVALGSEAAVLGGVPFTQTSSPGGLAAAMEMRLLAPIRSLDGAMQLLLAIALARMQPVLLVTAVLLGARMVAWRQGAMLQGWPMGVWVVAAPAKEVGTACLGIQQRRLGQLPQ